MSPAPRPAPLRPRLALALTAHRDEATAAAVLRKTAPAPARLRDDVLAFADHLEATGNRSMAAHARRVAGEVWPVAAG